MYKGSLNIAKLFLNLLTLPVERFFLFNKVYPEKLKIYGMLKGAKMTAKEESIVIAIWGPNNRIKSTKLYIPKQVMESNKNKLFYILEAGQSFRVKALNG
jgi:hypothetical protein